jgi:hypothetical protein
MSSRRNTENLIRVKIALADKYERLARNSRSKARRITHWRAALRFRRQAVEAGRP